MRKLFDVEMRVHDGVHVARDDLFPGGTKARFIAAFFDIADEVVYASPPEGGAQTALAWVARALGRQATIFTAKRAHPHARSLLAKAWGARVYQVEPGYLSVVHARAREYCDRGGAYLAPFGMDTPEAVMTIARTADQLQLEPAEVWCAAGSGVLARGLALAFPKAQRHVVQIGRVLQPSDVAGATVHVYPAPFGDEARTAPPFPADPHYDAKAWEICLRERGEGPVLFWNVTGPAYARRAGNFK